MTLSANPAYAWLLRKSLPSVAVVMLYLSLYGRPMHVEVHRLRGECNRHSSDALALNRRESELAVELEALQHKALNGMEGSASPAEDGLLISTLQESSAQTFARLLAILDSYHLACTQTLRKEEDALTDQESLAYTLQLDGEFKALSSALEEIHASLPDAAPIGLSMLRPRHAQCRWEIEFRFKKKPQRVLE